MNTVSRTFRDNAPYRLTRPMRRPAAGCGRTRSLLLATLAGIGLAACQPSVPPAPDHLVMICLDTVRYDAFLERDIEDDLTPWLPRAVNYTQAHSTAPWTMPGVASLLTGLYPQEHGAGRFASAVANLDTEVPSALPESAKTLTELLDERYFRTGAFVSHPFFKADLGLDQGFQQLHNRRGWWRDLDRMWQWADRQKPPARIFGYLHFMEAHHRHTQDDEALRSLLAEVPEDRLEYLVGLHPKNCADRDSRRCLQTLVYDNAVIELRGAVAKVLSDLQERDLLDRTLVLVYSDHGEEFWDHEEIQLQHGRDPREMVGLGHGQNLYQELLRVPLLLWHPGIEGRVIEQPVSLVDVVPSLVTWLSLDEITPVEETFSGEWLPPLRRSWFGNDDDRVIYASGIAYGPEQIATRKQDEKSIFSLDDESFEFYDLAADPLEREPLADPAARYEFEALTGDYLEYPTIAEARKGGLGNANLEDLKAIGYLQGVEEDGADATTSTAGETGTASEMEETPEETPDATREDGAS